MKNVLLLIPTETYRAQAFIDASRHLEISLTIASQDKLPMAHRMGNKAVIVSLEDPETAVKQIEFAARTSHFDAIVSIDDNGLKTAALASQRLGLKHISSATTDLSQNKISMRTRLAAANINQPKYQTFHDEENLKTKLSSIGKFPVVLKPATLSGSLGVIRANTYEEVRSGIPIVRSIQSAHGCDSKHPILIEEYIDGREYAVEAIVIDSNLHVLSIFDKPQPLAGPFFAETIYVTPTSLPRQLVGKLYRVLDRARTALGIETGPIHAEFRITGANEIYFIELAARSIGGSCSKAVPLAGGTTIEVLILAEALGITVPDLVFENQASGVYMIPVPRKGRLRQIKGIDNARSVKWITGIDMTYTANAEVAPIPYDAKYLGFIFSKAPTARIAVRALEEAHQKLEMDIS
ncbi:MAG: ATP-grasp domain-containing protein [Acidimicrobiaceae bacterium]|nr:ATP-grasp domain-containing protein [Acidimicrobiaceae bacterium]